MSFYTEFGVAESLLTSTTTAATLASTDGILAWDVATNKPWQTTAGQVGSIMTVSTSSSTATALQPYGMSVLTTASSAAWTLTDPPVKGLSKILFVSTTTSTNNQIVTQGATIQTTAANTATTITIQGSGAGFVDLTSVSTSVWLLGAKGGTIATS